mmetsp:Transcript_17125/g.20365  ORF Transcript_17125/g.20365 Transcript_17125/m.20365 type:complete len:478 (-) Transcript_17125:280-1713(-)
MITRALFASSLPLIIAVASTAEDTPHYLPHTLGNPPCLRSCSRSNDVLTYDTLQKCVDRCADLGHCCRNRLDTGDDVEDSSDGLLSCANGCEIAFFSTTVDACELQCEDGNNFDGCDYKHPNPFTKLFDKCGDCDCNKYYAVSSTDCRDGCRQAETLDEFYNYTDIGGCVTEDIPRFLFAGQSNMVGYPGEAKESLFLELINTLKAAGGKKPKIQQMRKYLINASKSTWGSSQMEAKLMFKLRKYIKKKNFNTEDYKKAICSFTDPLDGQLDCERNVSPTACGNDFGPELMFGHSFPKKKSPLKGKRIGIIKIAQGGTTIKKNWMKVNDGKEYNYWQYMVDGITASNGSIEAFVWFQGESDSLDSPDKEDYLDNLTTFVGDVRNEISKSSTKFKTPADVPVVIVELGNWIYLDIDTTVVEAQRTFVNNTANTVRVNTGINDNPKKRLSKFYHFNAASQMIIGDRIAKAVAKLLGEDS